MTKMWLVCLGSGALALTTAGALRLAAQNENGGRTNQNKAADRAEHGTVYVQNRPEEPRMDPADRASLDLLDASFQERFQTVDDKNFGLRRITTTPEHTEFERVRAETPAEKQAVRELSARRREALFMVAGLSVGGFNPLAPVQEAAVAAPEGAYSRLVSKPIRLAGKPGGQPAPSQAELLPGASRSLIAFYRAPSYQFTCRNWRVLARPIRAEKAACLQCHQQDAHGRKLSIGDTVGVALYAVAAPKMEAPR